MTFKLTPDKPPYYESVAQKQIQLSQSKTDLIVVPNGETIIYDTYTIPGNTIKKSGDGLLIQLWANATVITAQAHLLINCNNINIAGAAITNPHIQIIEFYYLYQDEDTATGILQGVIDNGFNLRQLNILTGRDWTVDQLMEIKIQNVNGAISGLASRVQNIFSNT